MCVRVCVCVGKRVTQIEVDKKETKKNKNAHMRPNSTIDHDPEDETSFAIVRQSCMSSLRGTVFAML